MPQNPWRLVIGGIVVLAVGMGVGRFVYTPILPVMMDALGLTTSQAGLIASSNYLGHIVGALLAASPIFKGSRYFYLQAAMALNAAMLLVMGLTDAFAAHLVIRFVAGVVGAFVVIFSSALVLDRLAVQGRASLSSMHFGGVGFGIAFSAAVVAWMLAEGAGWRSLWFASGVIGIAGFAAGIWLIPPSEPPATNAKPKAIGKSLFALRAMITAYGLFGFGYIITATFVVAIVRDAPETRALEPYIWTLFGISTVPSVAFWMRISDRVGMYHAFAIACLVEAVGVAGSMLWLSTVSLIMAVICVGGTMAAITAFGLVAVRNLSTIDPRTNIALATAAFGIGQAIGPTFAGYVHDWLGSFLIPSLIAAFALVVAAGLAMAASAHRPPETSSSVPVT